MLFIVKLDIQVLIIFFPTIASYNIEDIDGGLLFLLFGHVLFQIVAFFEGYVICGFNAQRFPNSNFDKFIKWSSMCQVDKYDESGKNCFECSHHLSLEKFELILSVEHSSCTR